MMTKKKYTILYEDRIEKSVPRDHRLSSLDKVRKTAKIRRRYNQVPHLTQDTTWESNKNTINITNKSKEASPFPAGDHKAAMNRRESMRNTRHKKHKRSTKEVPPWNGQ